MTDISRKILIKLKKQQKEGALPLLIEFYQELLRAQAAAEQRISPPSPKLNPGEIQARLKQGKPLGAFEELDIDWALAQKVFGEIAAVFGAYPQLFGPLPDAGKTLNREAVKKWFDGNSQESPLSDSIIQASMYPFLAVYAAAFKSALTQPVMEEWRRGYCPVCGGSPDIAYLEKEVGARWLVCSRCDTAWLFQRLQCPFCGNQEQESLSYFMDEKEYYRLYVCGKCKTYLKTVDLRKTETEVLMPLERLTTLDLDGQAAARGYHPHK